MGAKQRSVVSIHGPLGYGPNTLTTAPLRSCPLHHSTIGKVVSQIKPNSLGDTTQSEQGSNAAKAALNALPGRLELPTLRLTAPCLNKLS